MIKMPPFPTFCKYFFRSLMYIVLLVIMFSIQQNYVPEFICKENRVLYINPLFIREPTAPKVYNLCSQYGKKVNYYIKIIPMCACRDPPNLILLKILMTN